MRVPGSCLVVFLLVVSCEAQTISPVSSKDVQVIINTGDAKPGDVITLLTAKTEESCVKSKTKVRLQTGAPNVVRTGSETTLAIAKLKQGTYVCAVINSAAGSPSVSVPAVQVDKVATQAASNDSAPKTADEYKDRGFDYRFLGGVEQSDLSAQSSVTQGFYDLTMRENLGDKKGAIWFRSRYLGVPSASSQQNIVAATTDPSGTLTAKNLPQTVEAVDYAIGYEFFDVPLGDKTGKLTLNPILGVGATTPLSATTVVSGFAVPAYGSNECNQLQKRFTTGKGYDPSLPPSGAYDTTGALACVVMPNPASTNTNPLPGTEIKNIGFSNEDRSSFLIKWVAGIRLTDRWFVDSKTGCDSLAGCSRLTADFTIGQDQAITGGLLRHYVLKADATIPILNSGFYFFAASSNQLERNRTLSPLILSPVTLATNTATSTCAASGTTVCYPSPNVFILPYKQQDRDYYRIGIGIDAMKILTKLFPSVTGAATTPK